MNLRDLNNTLPAAKPRWRSAVRGQAAYARAANAHRPAVVLIMVVAVLGILFVAGAALLSVVTFSSRSIDAARVERENREAVDALEQPIWTKLRDGFLAVDGTPYTMETPLVMHQPGQPLVPCVAGSDCVLALPTYGEQPGVQPWIDVSEPIEDATVASGQSEFRLMSNLRAAVANRSPQNPAVASQPFYVAHMNVVASAPAAVPGPGGSYTSGGSPMVNPVTANAVWQTYNDADGDGVLDGLEMTIPSGVLPPSLQRSLADRLRATNYPGGDVDRLTLTLRILDHGAMVDLNDAHPYLKRTVLGYSPVAFGSEPSNTTLFAGAPYLPDSNEWFLRNRGLMLPLNLQSTRLVDNLWSELLAPQTLPGQSALYSSGPNATLLDNPTMRRWWRYDPVADTANGGAWRTLVDPAGASSGTYDVAHNVTTLSKDDNLMRGWVRDGLDMRSWVRSKEPTPNAPYNAMSDRHAIDNYPPNLDGHDDPRAGRLKVSLPGLDAIWRSAGGPDRVMRTVRDAFMLMLQNRPLYDFDADGSLTAADRVAVDRADAITAAMLTANLIDYMDNDGETLTRVPVVDTNGLPVNGFSGEPLLAFGFERQPFITEIYTKMTEAPTGNDIVVEGSSSFIVELYNPYDQPLTLSDYRLVDLVAEDKSGSATTELRDETFAKLNRFDVDLPSLTIPANGYQVLCGYGVNCPDPDGALGSYAIDKDSIIALKRKVKDLSNNDIEIIVDRMNCSDDDDATVRREPGAPAVGSGPDIGTFDSSSSESEVDLQRDTTALFWRFTVPRAMKLFGVNKATIGAANTVSDDVVYPFHVDTAYQTANTGSFTFAFPTTGSMLYISREAHLFDATQFDSAAPANDASLISPFNRVSPHALGYFKDGGGKQRERNVVGQYDQIDNGRLPVFDVRPDVDQPRERNIPAAAVAGTVEGLDLLPWGQLIYDYFTAVPYEIKPADPTNPVWVMSQGYNRPYPPVEQAGLEVRGRININTAPWSVLAGLPMLDAQFVPLPYRDQFTRVVKSGRTTLGENLAKAIVAYREGRDPWDVTTNPGNYERDRSPYGAWSTANYRPRFGYGFLTVGELANLRDPSAGVFDPTRPELSNRFDADATTAPLDATLSVGTPYPVASYEHAIALLVALDDNWATTKSHVFTVYGVVRGAHFPLPDPTDSDYAMKLSSFREADQKAIRFQTTVDRLPMFFGARQPERIGSRIMGPLVDDRSE